MQQVPLSFAEFTILSYINFVSIITALSITIITTSVVCNLLTVEWSAWPLEDISLKSAFLSMINIVLT